MNAPMRDVVRAAMRDRSLWSEITATEAGRSAVLEELERLNADVGAQMTARAAELSGLKDETIAGVVSRAEAGRQRREHGQWMAAATRFRSIVSERIAEIRPLVSDTHRRLSSESNRYRELVIALTKAIYLHQAEELDDEQLYDVLEEKRIQDGMQGDISLFDLAARILGDTAAIR